MTKNSSTDKPFSYENIKETLRNEIKFVINNSISFFESLGTQLLALLVPILIGYLLEPQTMQTSSKYSCQLHEQSLQWLMKIGPKYPQEFKALMTQSTDLRTKLESAIRFNQQNSNHQKQKNDPNAAAKNQQNNQVKPTIELKTNFGNFTSSK